MQNFIEKFGVKALDRFLDTEEKKLIKNHTTAAGFWAAKEAASKAIGTGIGSECTFFDITISKTQKGAPQIEFSEKLCEKYKISQTSLSISHDGGFAIAAVIIETSKN